MMRQLQEWAVDGQDLYAVRCVSGPSGSGKTHLIKKELARWQEEENRATCVISITEAFSIDAVALQLHQTILRHGVHKNLGLCFHLNFGKFKAHEVDQWKSLMQTINRFFFSLLVRKTVSNPPVLRMTLLSYRKVPRVASGFVSRTDSAQRGGLERFCLQCAARLQVGHTSGDPRPARAP